MKIENIEWTFKECYPELIASEVKDIAIAFAKNRSRIIATTPLRDYLPTDEELFSDFITNYYK